jgi:arylsulfatase A-like enzyme
MRTQVTGLSCFVTLGIAVAAALSWQPPAEGATAPGKTARPNVIILLTDDQGYADMSCHGNPRVKTPNIDRLHDESIRFTDFHVAPICTATRSQLLSGCDALANGASNASSGRAMMRRGLPTLGDVFAGSGYSTAMFGKWHVGHSYPYRPQDRGFQEAVWFPVSQISSLPDVWLNDYVNDRYMHRDKLQSYSGYCTDVFFHESTEWIRAQQAAGTPFFLYLALNAAHYPYFVEEKYSKPYGNLKGNLPNFFGMIANIDENLGKFDAMLRETGLADNTVLIFMTDNGSAVAAKFYNAGMRGQKFELWEGGHRVPCFVRWPAGNLRAAGDVSDLTECQDILPTLIDLCGLQSPARAKFDGVSLAPLLRGQAESWPDRMLVVQYSIPNTEGLFKILNVPAGTKNASRPIKGLAAVMWKHWRLVDYTQLYDVQADPAQKADVAAKHPDIVKKMQAHYDGWWEQVDPKLDTFEPAYVGTDKENPVVLSADEWGDVWIDQSQQVRAGERTNGVWHIEVAAPGEYEFALRRWPTTAAVPIRDGVSAHRGEIGGYKAGVALPIAKARLKLGEFDGSQTVGPEDESVAFDISLKQGPAQLQTWFYDADGREICGAYYVVVTKK